MTPLSPSTAISVTMSRSGASGTLPSCCTAPGSSPLGCSNGSWNSPRASSTALASFSRRASSSPLFSGSSMSLRSMLMFLRNSLSRMILSSRSSSAIILRPQPPPHNRIPNRDDRNTRFCLVRTGMAQPQRLKGESQRRASWSPPPCQATPATSLRLWHRTASIPKAQCTGTSVGRSCIRALSSEARRNLLHTAYCWPLPESVLADHRTTDSS